MPNPPRPPDPKPGAEWDWEDGDDNKKKKKLGLCHEGWKTCTVPKPQKDGMDEVIWCLPSDKCDTKDKPCKCWLFHAKEGADKWEQMPKPQEKRKYDPDYFYACFCVRILKS